MKINTSVMLEELLSVDRFDAEFFRPEYVEAEDAITRIAHKPVSDLVGTIKRGIQPLYDDAGNVPVVRTVNVRETGLSGTRQQFVTEAFVSANPRGKVHKGDVLVTSTGVGTLGRVCFVDEASIHFADGHIAYLRDVRDVHPLYLTTLLQSRYGVAMLYRRQRGSSGQMEIYPDDLASIPIPLFKTSEAEIVALREVALTANQTAHKALAAAESRLMEALGLDRIDLTPEKCYTRRYRDLQKEGRFDAEYFNPKYQRIIKKLRGGGQTLADVAPLSQQSFDPSKREKGSTFRYIEIGSLTGDGEAEAETLDVADAPSRAKWIVKPGDIITSTVRPIVKPK